MINIKIACSKVLFHFFECLQRSCEHCFFTFYRCRVARKQYLCHFIVAVQRGNNIYAVLSSPRSAETISLPFYRRRAARKQYFCISSFAALLRALKFLFSSLQNGDRCWNGRGGAYVPARTSAQRRFHTKTHALCVGIERWMRPCKATRAGTQAPPLPISIIFFHTIPHKQNNHSHAIHQMPPTVHTQSAQTKPTAHV